MTRPDLDAIRARCEAAAPGPWKVQDHDGWYWSVVKTEEEDDGWMPEPVFDDGSAAGEYGVKCKPHDRDFLVAARTDIPALLAYIDELERRTTYTVGETEWAHRIATLEHMLSEERENVDTLRARVAELEAEAATLRHRDALLKRVDDALAEAGCVEPLSFDGTIESAIKDLARRATRAEQLFVDEYDARRDVERQRDELQARIAVLEAMR